MKFINKLFKNKFLVGLGVVMLLVLAMRLWSFGDLLTFKMDQARDVKLIEEAYNGGVGELPLFGPRAAKTYLRLGPIFYYFEYLSMFIFGDQPWAVAVPDLIFSILTIPLFYYFLRQAFNKKVSFLTTVVFASSFFLNQYGRFAWNPNSIPFWSLLYFLGLYKVVNSTSLKLRGIKSQNQAFAGQESVKSLKFGIGGLGSGRWLLVAVVGYGVASQLHFTAMLAYPLIGGLFGIIFWKRKWWQGISWKYWLGAIAILGIMYLPVVLSELYTHGNNWIQFKYALSGRGKEEFSLYAKIIQSVKLHSEYFWFSLSSWSDGAGMIGLAGFFGIVLGAIFSVWKKFQDTMQANGELRIINDELQRINGGEEMINDKSQMTNNIGENRIIWFGLVFVWAVVMFLLYTKLAFNVLKPRYWLLEAPIFFVVLAVFLERLLGNGLKKIKGKYVAYSVVIVLVGMNLWATGNWYWELKNQKDSSLPLWHLKLKDQNKIPWGQLQKSVNYIENLSKQTDKEVCFYTTGEYRPVYDYIFKKQGFSEKIRRISFSKDTNDNCLFVAIDHHRHRETPRIPKDHKSEFEKVEKREVGFVTVWKISRKPKVKSQKSNDKSQMTNDKKMTNDKSQITNDGGQTNSKIQDTRYKQIPRYKIQDTNKFQDTNDKERANDKVQANDELQITNDKVQVNDSEEMTNDKSQMTNDSEEMTNDKSQITKDKGQTNDKSQITKEKIKKPSRVERVRWRDILNFKF